MINTVAIMGRLTYDPELRSTPSGVSVIRFQVACDRNYQRAGAERQADFIDCVAWRQTAEFISKYFKKGSMVALEGSIQTRSWDDTDGKKRYATEVIVNQVYFAESKRDAQAEPIGSDSYAASDFGSLPDPISPMGTDDDLPF